jgi:DNA-directed RNA polymerase subunit RPC12/RpoP
MVCKGDTMEIKEYKCPNCGGAVTFDSGLQKMKCPYCDAEFEVAALAEYEKQLAKPETDRFALDASKAGSVWDESDLGDLSTGSCPSCGAELIGDKNTIATVCPCCGNTQIMQKRVQGLLKPEYVIPFQLDKKAAKEALTRFYKGKKLLPNLFKSENHVNSIQGLYVPFWLFDAKAQGSVSYKTTKVSSWSDSKYNYTRTDYYSVQREGSLGFEKISVDGSEKMDDDYMDSIEPFDYGKLTGFQTAYLSGYIAEKYDVGIEASKERAIKRIKNSVESHFASSVTGYSTVIKERSSVNVENGKVAYSLFPVWILNTRYKNQNYQFVMNGQSGLMVGKLPADKGKVLKYRLLYFLGFGAAFSLIIALLQMFL